MESDRAESLIDGQSGWMDGWVVSKERGVSSGPLVPTENNIKTLHYVNHLLVDGSMTPSYVGRALLFIGGSSFNLTIEKRLHSVLKI